ncbi:MAG: hypothetical protein OXM55_04700 [Bdellovibrionales bacterium]|nr:hypothetical protein [Bdellovibrionales bacterium]
MKLNIFFLFFLSCIAFQVSANDATTALYDGIEHVDRQIANLDEPLSNLKSQAKMLIRKVSTLKRENERLLEEIKFIEENGRRMYHYDKEGYNNQDKR